MSFALKKETLPTQDAVPCEAPVVVVGSGPVGVRTVQLLLRTDPARRVVLYGDEPWEPYNRVRLTQMLAGHSTWAEVFQSLQLPDIANIETRYNCPVVSIDPAARTVTDGRGQCQAYSRLVLALGSRPHVPNVPGTDLGGVFTLRNMSDVQGLLARRVRSRRTLVIGGGLLGIEAARALQRSHTEVAIVEHGQRLMERQLDEPAGTMMREQIAGLGIASHLGDGLKAILGERLVSAVQLRSGAQIDCDTVVIATGIIPNTQLARDAGISVGRGIRVNDQLQTSDPNIYAVGECTEHRGRIYGLVAPGLEQASVAAHHILGRKAEYQGSIAAANLKVLGQKVFSIGCVSDNDITNLDRQVAYRGEDGRYRKLVIRHQKLVGAVAMGDWGQVSRIQEAVTYRRRVWPWQLWRFKRSGELWPGQVSEDVRHWPAGATVCNCTGVTRGALSAAMVGGCDSVQALSECTGAASVCGSCTPKLVQLLGAEAQSPVQSQPQPGRTALWVSSALAMLLLVVGLTLNPIDVPATVQGGWHLSALWTDGLYKQISGFTLLGLSLIGLLLSLRKRVRRFTLGSFGHWRVVHAGLGLATLGVLLLHTGLSLGANLNFFLMVCFVGLALLGGVAGVVTAYESGRASLALGRLRRCSTWAHILLFWPLPVLLGVHILKSYWF